MSKILNVFVFSLLFLLVACNQEETENIHSEEVFPVIQLTVETYSLEEFNAGIENVASVRDGKTTVFFDASTGEMVGTTGPSTDLIIVCYGAPASDPDAQCIGIRGSDSCNSAPSCSVNDTPPNPPGNCFCYQ